MGCTQSAAFEDPAAPTASRDQKRWTKDAKPRAVFQVIFLGLDQGGKTSLIHSLVHAQHGSATGEAADGGATGAPPGETTAASGSSPAPAPTSPSPTPAMRAMPVVPPPTSAVLSSVALVEGERVELLDLPGDPKERKRWEDVMKSATAVVFVVDSADPLRIPVAKRELWNMVEHLRQKSLPVLVLANKQDVDHSVEVQSLAEALDLGSLRNITDPAPLTIRGSSMFNPTDTRHALRWLLTAVLSLESVKSAEREIDNLESG